MSQTSFKIVAKICIPIQHFLMKRPDVSKEAIQIIMAHPQVFKQCKKNLKRKYPHLVLKSGHGDLIDTATAAKAVSEGKLSKNIAILGPKTISGLYRFDIIDENLQDKKYNTTTFLLVKHD
jgi:chorismate mutase / prephenate dehydratase